MDEKIGKKGGVTKDERKKDMREVKREGGGKGRGK